jgi:hypothetical protein
MSEYELASLLQGQIKLIGETNLNFFTFVTAYVAASYLVAHRLTVPMAAIVTALFVMYQVLVMTAINQYYEGARSMADQIQDFARAGRGLAWHPAAAATPAYVYGVFAVNLGAQALALAGAIYFFFHCRRSNRPAAA